MPNKFNAERRHHIPKMKSAVTSWAQYETGLRRRGSLTMWITEEAIDGWEAARRSTPGGQATYSDGAIETCLMLRTVFKLPLRQAEGLMLSVVELLGCEMAVPACADQHHFHGVVQPLDDLAKRVDHRSRGWACHRSG